MRNRALLFIPLVLFALLAAGFAISFRHAGAEKFASHLNEPAPVFSFPLLDGAGKLAAEDWRGRAYILNFFASWCLPCRAENPALMRLAAQGAPILGVAIADKAADTRGFLGKEGNPFKLAATDESGRALLDWGMTGVPETFLIDRQGVIRFHEAGPLTEEEADKLFSLWRVAQK